MKNNLYTFIILVLLYSCNNSIKTESVEIHNISKFDSIKTGYGGFFVFEDTINLTTLLSNESQKIKPLAHTELNDPLGDLYMEDTLKLFAEFCQCGEFGGNKEYINVYRAEKYLECIIITDTVSCRYDKNGKKYFRISQEKYQLTESSINAIVDYLELLMRYSLKDKEWHANVAGYFSAEIIRNVDYRKDFSIDVFDSEGQWIYFDILKNEIKTTANILYK